MPKVHYAILAGTIMGTIARFYLLIVDYRQYPSYPQGYTIHLTFGAIASALGAVTIPAILNKDYSAITFIALAAQHFRDVRKMERESLEKIEQDELVKRGQAYIEDISKKFESRNYVAMLTGLTTVAAIYITKKLLYGPIAGIAVLFVMRFVIKPRTIETIAEVRPAKIHFKGSLLAVENIVLTNVGLKEAREKLLKDGLAVMIIPRDDNARVTLSNIGQRQAIIHDLVSILGIRQERDEPEFTPISKRDPDSGNVAVVALLREPDIECMIEVVKKAPLLEASRRQPLDSYIGRKAAD